MRDLNEDSCSTGVKLAQSRGYCAFAGELSGGIRKVCFQNSYAKQAFQECCDCCLLAKDLLKQNEPCEPLDDFSPSCLSSFNRCCQSAANDIEQQTGSLSLKSNAVQSLIALQIIPRMLTVPRRAIAAKRHSANTSARTMAATAWSVVAVRDMT